MPKAPKPNRHISNDRTAPYADSTSLRTTMDVSNPASAGASERSSASPWTEGEDHTLMGARQKGLNWALIATKHFPSKTPNACRKRHERLMDKRKSQDNWDVEALAQAYMEVRERMWQILASRLSQDWQAVEGKVILLFWFSKLFPLVSLCRLHRICCTKPLRHHHVNVAMDSKHVSSGCESCTDIPDLHVHDRGAVQAQGINRPSRPVHWLIRVPTCPFCSAWRKASRRCKPLVGPLRDGSRITGPSPTTAAVTSMTHVTTAVTATTATTMAVISAAKSSCPRTPATCPPPRRAPTPHVPP